MKMMQRRLANWFRVGLAICCTSALAYPDPTGDTACASPEWAKMLPGLLFPDAELRFDQTGGTNSIPDCTFHQWSWEAFIWGTALNTNGVPRFMEMTTPAELVDALSGQAGSGPRTLRLGVRPLHGLDPAAQVEGAGAIVEADGNMLVAPNGYPVYASVHMNDSYALTASGNMMFNGDFDRNTNDYFNVGALVFKATWLRLDTNQAPPRGAFVTRAEVPWLTTTNATTAGGLIAVPSGSNMVVNVALLGLHVVGFTEKHPEFLWGTFEHHLNAPMLADNTFTTAGTSTNDFTLYRANTPFSQHPRPADF
jgi:hypothetical protein